MFLDRRLIQHPTERVVKYPPPKRPK
jgi:hypothetical protein